MVNYYISTIGQDSNDGLGAGSNHAWLTIAHALATVTAGSIVNILAGTYPETNWICTISGSIGNYITFQNYPGDSVTINFTGYGVYTAGINTNGCAYLKFIGLDIVFDANNNTDGSYGFLVNTGSDHITIQNCYITHSRWCGICLYYGTNYTVDNCELNDCRTAWGGEENLSIEGCSYFEVMHTKVHDAGSIQALGITVKEGGDHGKIHDCEIYNLPGMWNGGIYMENEHHDIHDIDIYNNKIHDLTDGTGFNISDEKADADPHHMYNINAYNNIIWNCAESGMAVYQWATEVYTSIHYINNTCYNNSPLGWPEFSMKVATAYGSSDIIAQNNIVCSITAGGLPVMDAYGAYPSIMAVDHNLFYNSGGDWDMYESTFGDSYQIGDPLFVNATAYNFHIQSSSPAKNNGLSTNAPSTDYDGLSRPQGSAYCIGAYEYTSGGGGGGGDGFTGTADKFHASEIPTMGGI